MELSDKDLKHLANLAALSLDEQEAKTLRAELGTILEYVATLSNAATNGVEPSSHVQGETTLSRDDINQESLTQEQVNKLAADFAHGGFRVPKVL